MKLPETFAGKNLINVIIETPKGSRNKFAFQPETGLYELTKVLPAGTSFPFDFGFIPRTIAPDGDPLDVLVIVETECFPGCTMKCRPIGVLKAMQREKGSKPERNDRIFAVPVASIDHSELTNIHNFNKNLLKEVIHFFEYYNSMRNKEFKFIGIKGPKEALRITRRLQRK